MSERFEQTGGVDKAADLRVPAPSRGAVGTTGPESPSLAALTRSFERFNTLAHSPETIDRMVDADLASDQMGSR